MGRNPQSYFYNRLITREEYDELKVRRGQSLKKLTSILLTICVVLLFVIIGYVAAFAITNDSLNLFQTLAGKSSSTKTLPKYSNLRKYKYTAVDSDSNICSMIGNYMMTVKGGSAIDGAIATQLCTGIVNMYLSGIGGGSFMLIYKKKTNEIYSFDYRETAPAAATADMFVNKKEASVIGGLAIGIPGEIAGYYEAWKKFGRLKWKELFTPVIHMCRYGYRISKSMGGAIKRCETKIRASAGLRELLVDPVSNETYKTGHLLKNPKLAKTLRTIANDPFSFYRGTLAKRIVKEIQNAGGIITLDDLKNYRPVWRQPIKVPLRNTKLTVYSLPPPSSGALLAFMLAVLDGYNMTKAAERDLHSTALYYHRLLETFKFAYAKRSALADLSFADKNITQMLKNLTSPDYAEGIRKQINDNRTYDVEHYGPVFDWKEDHGTCHTSLVSPEGDAVAVTSTINTAFGSAVRGYDTGIIYNNEMDDFSTPNTTNEYGLPSSRSNYIVPGKRPMSSMTPAIITDGKGSLVLIIGGAGGSHITTGVAYVSSRVLFFQHTMKQAVDFRRIHHQLVPNVACFEDGFPLSIIEILKKKGHKIAFRCPSIVQAINVRNGYLHAYSDPRRGGRPSGQ